MQLNLILPTNSTHQRTYQLIFWWLFWGNFFLSLQMMAAQQRIAFLRSLARWNDYALHEFHQQGFSQMVISSLSLVWHCDLDKRPEFFWQQHPFRSKQQMKEKINIKRSIQWNIWVAHMFNHQHYLSLRANSKGTCLFTESPLNVTFPDQRGRAAARAREEGKKSRFKNVESNATSRLLLPKSSSALFRMVDEVGRGECTILFNIS